MMTDILNKLAERQDLTAEEATAALQSVVDGAVGEAETAAFLFGMRAKGETVEEMAAFVEVMRKAAVPVRVCSESAVDVCGTGGDHSGTFNISTAVMFTAAGAGVPVFKHGNRSVSSRSGSVDVLEALGAAPMLPKRAVEICIGQTGMAFMFAPLFHPAMKHVVPVRRALKMRTFFNLMGPMINPAGVKRQVIGAYNLPAAEMMAGVMSRLGMRHVLTVHSDHGIDELTPSAPSTAYRVTAEGVEGPVRIDAADLGFGPSTLDDLKGGDAAENAAIIRDILDGRRQGGARDAVVLNAAYAILASGITNDENEAVAMAADSIDSGLAAAKLAAFVACTQDLSRSEEGQL